MQMLDGVAHRVHPLLNSSLFDSEVKSAASSYVISVLKVVGKCLHVMT